MNKSMQDLGTANNTVTEVGVGGLKSILRGINLVSPRELSYCRGCPTFSKELTSRKSGRNLSVSCKIYFS